MRRRKDVTHICMSCFRILFHSCIRFSRSWASVGGTGLFLLIRRYSSSQRFSIEFWFGDLDGQSIFLTFLLRSNVKIALTSACVTSDFISPTAKSLSCKNNRANQCFSVLFIERELKFTLCKFVTCKLTFCTWILLLSTKPV